MWFLDSIQLVITILILSIGSHADRLVSCVTNSHRTNIEHRTDGSGTLPRKVALGFETQRMDRVPKLIRRLRIQQKRIRSLGRSPEKRHKELSVECRGGRDMSQEVRLKVTQTEQNWSKPRKT